MALGGALLVNSKLARLRGLFRTIYFAPVVTTLVAVAVVFRYLYHPRYGLINQILGMDWPAAHRLARRSNLGHGGHHAPRRLAQLRLRPASSTSWVSRPSPKPSTKRRELDGAGTWRTLRDITLPLLMPTSIFVAVITTVSLFQIFAEPYVMTRGGPLYATTSITLLMYQQGFRWWNLGPAAAIAFVLFALIIAATGLQVLLRGRKKKDA